MRRAKSMDSIYPLHSAFGRGDAVGGIGQRKAGTVDGLELIVDVKVSNVVN